MSAASPYATALYSAAADAGRLNEVDGELAEIADAVRGTPALARALTNPAVSGEGKRNLLAELSKGADPIVSRFLQVLLDHRRLGQLSEIQEALADRVRLDRNELAVELTTAVAIDDATAAEVQLQSPLVAQAQQLLTLLQEQLRSAGVDDPRPEKGQGYESCLRI